MNADLANCIKQIHLETQEILRLNTSQQVHQDYTAQLLWSKCHENSYQQQKGRHLSTARAIELLTECGMDTPIEFIRKP